MIDHCFAYVHIFNIHARPINIFFATHCYHHHHNSLNAFIPCEHEQKSVILDFASRKEVEGEDGL